MMKFTKYTMMMGITWLIIVGIIILFVDILHYKAMFVVPIVTLVFHIIRYRLLFPKDMQEFTKPIIDVINSKIEGKTILDCGCGDGKFTIPLSNTYEIKGIDIEKKIDMCEVQSIYDIKDKDESYDIVFCSNVLHHLDSPQKAVKEMQRLSKRYIVILEPDRRNPLMFLFGLLLKDEHGLLKFSKKYLESLAGNIIYSTRISYITPRWRIPFGITFYNLMIIEK